MKQIYPAFVCATADTMHVSSYLKAKRLTLISHNRSIIWKTGVVIKEYIRLSVCCSLMDANFTCSINWQFMCKCPISTLFFIRSKDRFIRHCSVRIIYTNFRFGSILRDRSQMGDSYCSLFPVWAALGGFQSACLISIWLNSTIPKWYCRLGWPVNEIGVVCEKNSWAWTWWGWPRTGVAFHLGFLWLQSWI